MADTAMTLDDPQSGADRFLKYSTIGAISGTLVVAIGAIGMPSPASPPTALKIAVGVVILIAIVLFIRSLYVLFRTRNADEYVRGLWNAGTSTAFVAVTIWTVLRAILFGVAQAVSRYQEMPALQQIIDAKPHIFAVTIIAFFAAVLVQRSRSA